MPINKEEFKKIKEIYLIKSLEYLAEHQHEWTSWWNLPLPADWNNKMKLSIGKSLIKKGFSGGCDCGCRGDLCITDEGLAHINRDRTHHYIGY